MAKSIINVVEGGSSELPYVADSAEIYAEDGESFSVKTNGVKRARITKKGVEIVPTGSVTLPALKVGSPFSGLYSTASSLYCTVQKQLVASLTSTGFRSVLGGFLSPYSIGFSTPRLSFAADPTTGITSTGVDSLSGVISGTEVFRVSSADSRAITHLVPVSLLPGTAGSPSLCYSSDTDTGIYAGSSTTWSASTGGVERLRFSRTQIDYFVQMRSPAGTLANLGCSFDNDRDTGFLRNSSTSISLVAGGVVALTLTSSGATHPNGIRLGAGTDTLSTYVVGTTSPTLSSTGFTFVSPSATVNTVQIGRIVMINATLSWTGITPSTSGTVTLSNALPVAPLNVVQTTFLRSNNTPGVAAVNTNFAFFRSSGTSLILYKQDPLSAGSPTSNSFVGGDFNVGTLYFTLTYTAA